MADVLDTLAELERRYDGPIPEPHRRRVLDFAERRALIEATGQADLFEALIGGQIEAILRSRRNGFVPAHLLADLEIYRRHQLLWRREARRLQAKVTPSADDVL